MKVFIDTDVVISSLISQKGAAYYLINNVKITKYISDVSKKEIEEVAKRLDLDNFDPKKYKLVDLKMSLPQKMSLSQIKKNYKKFVFDIDDSHIVAGASASKSSFLITYNSKHFATELIKNKLGILVRKPSEFLQFLRSN